MTILYLIGFMLCYAFIKLKIREPEDDEWKDVILTFIMSIFSWLTLLLIFIMQTIEYTKENKPPKWL